MIRVLLVALTVTFAASVLALRLGGALGGGVLVGALVGVGITGLCLLYQRETMRTRPAAAIQAFGIAMLIKLAVLLIGTLALRFIDTAAERIDWRSFSIAFATVVAIVQPVGVIDAVRVLKERRAH